MQICHIHNKNRHFDCVIFRMYVIHVLNLNKI